MKRTSYMATVLDVAGVLAIIIAILCALDFYICFGLSIETMVSFTIGAFVMIFCFALAEVVQLLTNINEKLNKRKIDIV